MDHWTHSNMNSRGISFVFLCVVYAAHASNIVINTNSGPIEGNCKQALNGKNVTSFLGIPYAESPIGELRFKAPVAIKTWNETLKAYNFSKSCIQGIGPQFRTTKDEEWWIPDEEDESEDCLTLNIWVPTPVPEKAAVMVWIYGGVYEGGTSSSYKYDGQILATEGDVIVVTFNYRMNAFGFLYLESEEAPGNMGMMDQTLALKWIRENIESFGGDKEKVTIFGESSGGSSANQHLSIPSSRGLFKRAIFQSGTSNAPWAYKDAFAARFFAEELSKSTGCSKNGTHAKAIIDCFKKLDSKTIVKATNSINEMDISVRWAPVVDGNYFTLSTTDAFKNGTVDSGVEVLLGANTEEGSLFAFAYDILERKNDSFIDHPTFNNVIRRFLKTDNDLIVGLVRLFYTNWQDPGNPEKIREELIHFFTDLFFLCKTNEMGDLLVSNGNSVYRYQFSHHSSDSPFPVFAGASHGDDLSYVFGLPLNPQLYFTDEERKLSGQIVKFWSNFAKYGNPNGELEKDEWPKYSLANKDHINLGIPLKNGTGTDIRLQTCALWGGYYSKFAAAMAKTT